MTMICALLTPTRDRGSGEPSGEPVVNSTGTSPPACRDRYNSPALRAMMEMWLALCGPFSDVGRSLRRLGREPTTRLWARRMEPGQSAFAAIPPFAEVAFVRFSEFRQELTRTMRRNPRILIYSAGDRDVMTVEAATRAGALGVLDLSWLDPHGRDDALATAAAAGSPLRSPVRRPRERPAPDGGVARRSPCECRHGDRRRPLGPGGRTRRAARLDPALGTGRLGRGRDSRVPPPAPQPPGRPP